MNGDLATLAHQLRNGGASWEDILSQLQARGASRLDLVRAIRDVDGLSHGEATKIINDSGAVSTSEFEITIDGEDRFYDELFSDEYRGNPGEG